MKFLLVTTLLLLHVACASAMNSDDNEYRLGIFPYLAPRQTLEFFGPIAADMQKTLKHPVRLESVPSFADFRREMAAKRYDIALIQPFDYPEIVERLGYIPLAQMAVPLVTQLFVRDDSRYRTLKDLIGTSIALPPAESANARMALHALNEHNLRPGRDIEVHYFNSHDSCLQQVWVSQASACGTAKPPVAIFEKRMSAKMRAIYDTPPIPHIVFVAHPRLPAAARVKLQERIVGWSKNKEGQALLHRLGYPGFANHKPADYAAMRNYAAIRSIPNDTTSVARDLLLGVFPYLPARRVSDAIGPLLRRLSETAGQPLQLATATSYAAFANNIATAQYDIVLVQPYEYQNARAAGYLPLAAALTAGRAVFVIPKQSPAKALLDLKGKAVAMPPSDAAVSILARHLLADAGLHLGRDLRISTFRNHDACLLATVRGEADSCVTSRNVFGMLPASQRDAMRILAESKDIPGVVFMIHQRVAKPLTERLQKEIFGWPQSAFGREIVKTFGFGGFGPVNTSAYEALIRKQEGER